MKIIAIGDTHGRDCWKAIIEKEKDADTIVFMGDYFDSFDVPFTAQAENFMDIVTYKRDHPEKVILLIGNHDIHYLPNITEHYSGFQKDHAKDIGVLIDSAKSGNLLQIAYEHEGYLFTHAGVTQTWARKHGISGEHIASKINTLFNNTVDPFLFTPSTGLDNSGDSITQPPTWVRPRALLSDIYPGYVHVIGHTQVKNITGELIAPVATHAARSSPEPRPVPVSTVLIDTMDHSKEYLVVENGEISIGNLKKK